MPYVTKWMSYSESACPKTPEYRKPESVNRKSVKSERGVKTAQVPRKKRSFFG